MKKLRVFVLFSILLATLAACAPGSSIQVTTPETTMRLSTPGPNPLVNQADASGRLAGAGTGLWHGLISPVTLVISFFNSEVQMYEVHNSGSAYNLGFLLGVALIFALLTLFTRVRRRA
ncbi:MAG TPA: hypothetical protein VK206_28450 [Anaerolineales bacterium]|nr:hypothetical protein [Anaerolineales bacterium]HLO34072.1 hypothetical protein [Anaerolineales bacterium]